MLRSGLLAADHADNAHSARAKLAVLPPFIVAFFGQQPVIGTTEDALLRVMVKIEAGSCYITIIVMTGDEETPRIVTGRVVLTDAAG